MACFEKVLYPTDFSEAAEKCVAYIKRLKDAGTKKVYILHVINSIDISVPYFSDFSFPPSVDLIPLFAEFPELEREFLQSLLQKLKSIEEELQKAGLETQISIVMGEPAEEIVNFAKDNKVSLIVMPYKAKKGITGFFKEIGSTTRAVLNSAPCPVLVVRKAVIEKELSNNEGK